MALKGFRLCFFPCGNFFPNPGPTKSLYLGSTSPALSCNPTLGPTLVFALIPTPVPAPALVPVTTNELFKCFMKAYLKSNQEPKQLLAEYKQPFKTKISEVYYGKLHIDCYHFCQFCKDQFETAKATRPTGLFLQLFFSGEH